MRSESLRRSGWVLALAGILAACGGGGDDDGGGDRVDARRIDSRQYVDGGDEDASGLDGGDLADANGDDGGGPVADASGDDTDIRDLQNGSIAMGTTVRIAGAVVTARTDSATGSSTVLFLQEPTGAPEYSGIFVFVDTDPTPAFTLPNVGDIVTLDGVVNEFARAGLPGSRTNIDPVANIAVTGAGVVPAAVVVAEDDLTAGATSEQWEGVLVRVEPATVQSRDSFGAVTLTGGLIADDRLYAWTQPFAGDSFTSLTGVVDWDFGTARLYPRVAADLAGYVAAEPRVTTLAPGSASVSQGNSVDLTVTIDRPAPAGGQPVDLLSSMPSVAAVDVAIIVPDGATTATFPVDAIAPGGPVTITAGSGGTSATSQITVLAGGGPIVTSIEGAVSVLRNGGTGVALVQIDRPAPAGGAAVGLSSSTTDSVIVPATVVVAEGATEATFGIEGGATAGPALITATTPDGNATKTITALATAPAPTAVGQVVINEVLYDPPGAAVGDVVGDASCDGARGDGDEFIELYNTTTGPLDLAGISIWDNVGTAPPVPTVRATFPAFVLGAGEAVVVFSGDSGVVTTQPWCAGVTAGFIGDAPVFSGGAFQLNNGGDTITLHATADALSAVVASLTYLTGEASDQSLTQDPDGFGLYTTHGAATGHATDRSFSPGTMVTGAPWASVRP